jgi:hypothetical protein
VLQMSSGPESGAGEVDVLGVDRVTKVDDVIQQVSAWTAAGMSVCGNG